MSMPPSDDLATIEIFKAIGSMWGLSIPEQAALSGLHPELLESLGEPIHPSSVPQVQLSDDVRDRLAYITLIYDLNMRLGRSRESMPWLKDINQAEPFLGRTPLAYMLEGSRQALLDTMHYLMAMSQGRSPIPPGKRAQFKLTLENTDITE
jgi:hypothetical protein